MRNRRTAASGPLRLRARRLGCSVTPGSCLARESGSASYRVVASARVCRVKGQGPLVRASRTSSELMDTLHESYETFGKHLIPKFDTDPVHSTTRQREAQCGASYGTR